MGEIRYGFQPLYCRNNGRPSKPIRLMCGLLILKHLRNLSDESVVEQWSENAYYQYFCGMQEFAPGAPCASSELVHFRHRIGEKGIELIFQESLKGELDNYKRTNSVGFVQNVRSSILEYFFLTYPLFSAFGAARICRICSGWSFNSLIASLTTLSSGKLWRILPRS